MDASWLSAACVEKMAGMRSKSIEITGDDVSVVYHDGSLPRGQLPELYSSVRRESSPTIKDLAIDT